MNTPREHGRPTVGDRIARHRRRRGLSQRALAELLGRTEDWLSKVENNRIPLDRLSVIQMVASALGVTLGDLLDDVSLTGQSRQARPHVSHSH
ncbi:helix-turn-helix transcriptional regulator [Haloechinothrix sp. LS1_15]|uniref:helix-turn-helix domain-containing protein n=1 Tax=Haloechinothrix sp. LS1_15 TaxID=2652248 RepID=UPI00294AB983|nr:helix-turn-helix transcriptional regulator [Haloechinothrix sp. LS1_15]